VFGLHRPGCFGISAGGKQDFPSPEGRWR
jgi:hypothetical protein